MLGGGTYVTQNKVLPGAYINFVSAAGISSNLGERGRVEELSVGFAVEWRRRDVCSDRVG